MRLGADLGLLLRQHLPLGGLLLGLGAGLLLRRGLLGRAGLRRGVLRLLLLPRQIGRGSNGGLLSTNG